MWSLLREEKEIIAKGCDFKLGLWGRELSFKTTTEPKTKFLKCVEFNFIK